ncbi:hypothetical protein BsWGS_28833 [Bradybaena similaris]
MKLFQASKLTLLNASFALLLQSFVLLVAGIVLYNRPNLVLLVTNVDQSHVDYFSSKLGIVINVALIKLDAFIKPIAIIMMVIGGVSSIVCILALAVAKSDSIILTTLCLISTFAMLFTVLLVTAAFLWNKPTVKDIVRPELLTTLENYVGDHSNDSTSVVWNVIMLTWKCCGVNNYQDFKKLKSWQHVQTLSNVTVELLTPLVCCKESASNTSCAIKGTAAENNNWATYGCLEVISTFATANITVILNLMFIFLELLLIVTLIVFILAGMVVDRLSSLC